MATAKDNTSNNKINIVTNTESNVTVTRPVTNVIEIVTSGPRGPAGVAGASGSDGAPGPPGSISSSAFTSVTASVNALNEATSSFVLVSQTGSMSVATASFALFAVSASVEITKEVSSSHANTADVANGLQGQPSIDVTAITASGDVLVPQYIKHKDDENTFINFTSDQIRLNAGGINFMSLEKDASTPYPLTVNNGGNRINFRVLDRNSELLLKTNSEEFWTGLYFAGNQKLVTATDGINVTGNVSASGFISASSFTGIFNGALSSSAQIESDISGSFVAPSSSFSTRVTSLESNPAVASGTISGSTQITAFGFVSQSGGIVDLPNVKIQYANVYTNLSDLPSAVNYHGMFAHVHNTGKGYFAHAGEWIELVNAGGIVSSSAQLATEISGAFGAPSSSFSTRVTTLESGGVSIPAGTVSSSAQIATEISGAFVAPSSSFSTRVTTLEAGGGGGSGIFTDSNGFKVTTNNLIVSKSAAGALTSSLSVQGSGSGIFDVQGSVGQLFEVQDGLDGVLMSVNDISGIPILTVSSSGNIIIPNASRLIGTASVALSVPGATAAFPFTGNALITGDLDITGSGNDIFKVRSKSGSLFSVDDGLDGILMSVNDISGLPLFEVSSSGLVTLVSSDITGSATSTASFGHIIGDGSQLSNLPAATLPSGVLSGSAQIASNISGSFGATSSSLASRISEIQLFPFTGDAQITGSLIVSGSGSPLQVKTDSILVNVSASNEIVIGTKSPTSAGALLSLRHDFGSSNDVFSIKNGQFGNGIFKIVDNRTASTTTLASIFVGGRIYDYNSPYNKQIDLGGYGLGATYGGNANAMVLRNGAGNQGDAAGNIAISPNGSFIISNASTGAQTFTITNPGHVELKTGNISGSATSTASFGTYLGDGSGLTNLPSSFTAASISGSFTESSSSFSTRVTTNATNISTNTSNVSSNLTKINSLTSVTGSYATTASVSLQDLTITNLSGSLIPGDGSTISYAVTVVDSGGDKFAIDLGSGAQTTPAFSLIAGNTYRFTQDDGTNNNHPFGFSVASTDADYTTDVTYNGTAGQAGSYAQIVVSNSTPNLKYRCTVHGIGMGGDAIITIITGSQIENGFLTVSGSVNITGSFNLNGLNFDNAVSSSAAASGFGSGGGGSSFTAAGISGSFTAPSASFSTRVTTLEAAGGSSGTSTMIASGSTSASADPATGVVINHSGSTAFSVIGSEGTLFSVDDELDGILFTVNDRSGIPMFEVSSSGRIVADEGEAIIRSQRPIITVATNPFTASLDNVGQYFRVGGNVTCSIKANAIAFCPVGAEFDFFQTSSAGNMLFETGSGVTLNSKNGNLNLAGQFSSATLKCIDTDEWDLMGDLT